MGDGYGRSSFDDRADTAAARGVSDDRPPRHATFGAGGRYDDFAKSPTSPDGEVWDAEIVDEPWDPSTVRSAIDVEIVDNDSLDALGERLAATARSAPSAAPGPEAPSRAATFDEVPRPAGLASAFGQARARPAAGGPSNLFTPAASRAETTASMPKVGAAPPGEDAAEMPMRSRHRATGAVPLLQERRPSLLRRRVGPVPLLAVGVLLVLCVLLLAGFAALSARHDDGHTSLGLGRSGPLGGLSPSHGPDLAAADGALVPVETAVADPNRPAAVVPASGPANSAVTSTPAVLSNPLPSATPGDGAASTAATTTNDSPPVSAGQSSAPAEAGPTPEPTQHCHHVGPLVGMIVKFYGGTVC